MHVGKESSKKSQRQLRFLGKNMAEAIVTTQITLEVK